MAKGLYSDGRGHYDSVRISQGSAMLVLHFIGEGEPHGRYSRSLEKAGREEHGV